MRQIVPSKVPGFTGVMRELREPTLMPFTAEALEAPGWRVIGRASSQATAEAIAKGYRIDQRKKGCRIRTRTRTTETRKPGGFDYRAV